MLCLYDVKINGSHGNTFKYGLAQMTRNAWPTKKKPKEFMPWTLSATEFSALIEAVAQCPEEPNDKDDFDSSSNTDKSSGTRS